LADRHNATQDTEAGFRKNYCDGRLRILRWGTRRCAARLICTGEFLVWDLRLIFAGATNHVSMIRAVELPAALALSDGWLLADVAVHMATNVGSILRIDSIIFLPVARSRYKKRYP